MLTPERKSYCKKAEHTKDYLLWWIMPLLFLLISVIWSYIDASMVIDDLAIIVSAVANLAILWYCNWNVLKFRDFVALFLCFVFLIPTIIAATDHSFLLMFPVTTTLPLCLFYVTFMTLHHKCGFC
jgi:hypothetical protein